MHSINQVKEMSCIGLTSASDIAMRCSWVIRNRSEELTYVENPWSGGGNAGPALEVIVGGLELATLVFMNLRRA